MTDAYPIVIYHANCLDGFGAAFAAWTRCRDKADYVPLAHGDSTEVWLSRNRASLVGREVFVLDFSLPEEHMNFIRANAKKFVWLDHHKTAFEMECGGLDSPLVKDGRYELIDVDGVTQIILDNGQSGAMLAWKYFNKDFSVPMLIQHIDDYDRWQFKLSGTKELVNALWSRRPWEFSEWNRMLFSNDFSLLYVEGEAILAAHNQIVESTVAASTMDCRIVIASGHEWDSEIIFDVHGLASNCPPYMASDVGHELANLSGTFGLLWSVDKYGKVKCSMRSNGDYDVSAIAKVLGGGGHRNAAGFETTIETLKSWISLK